MDNFDLLISQFQDQINVISDAVSSGKCKDFEEYRFVCGQIRGLETACSFVKDLKTRLEDSDE